MSHLSVAPDSTAPPRRLINASQANGLAWSVWRELDDFLFEVSPLKARADDPPTVALYASAADFSTAHKAEQAAKAWCAAYVPPPAEGPPKPAKKSKGPKLNGHDHAAVLAAARTSSTVEASVELGCTPQQFEKFAEKNGVTLKLPEALPAKAGKARGRRGGAK